MLKNLGFILREIVIQSETFKAQVTEMGLDRSCVYSLEGQPQHQ